MNKLNYSTFGFQNQQGVVLAVCLVLLLVMTMLGIMSVGTATSEQKIANNNQFRSQSFQAADSAIDVAIANWGNLAAAMNGNVSANLAIGGSGVTSNSVTQYIVGLPDAADEYTDHHFTITGTGSINAMNTQIVTSQGLYIKGPKM